MMEYGRRPQSATILVVDDDPAMLRVVSRVVQKAGHEVLEATDGENALHLVREEAPDLVVLDVVLPGIDGLEVCRRIKHDEALEETPVILLSGLERASESQAAGLEVGADDYVARPVSNRELVARIEALLRLKRARDELRRQAKRLEQEVAERKRMERELQESHERYRRLVEHQGEGIGTMDFEERFTFANPAAHEIFGVEQGCLVGRSLTEFLDEEAVERVGLQTEARRAGKESTYELPIIRLDGQERILLVTATPQYDDEDRFTGTFGVFRDITERKRAEEALRASESLLRRVIDTSPNCIFVKDWDGEYILVNDAIAELYDTPKEEMVGRTDQDLVGMDRLGPEEAESFLADDREVMSRRQPKLIPEEPFTVADGTKKWFQTFKVPLEAGEGRARMLEVAVDITERKRMEEELRRQERLAVVGQLAAGIAHDFRNIMATILLYAEMDLRRPGLPPRLKDHLRVIVKQSNRATDLVQQILDFSSRAMIAPQALDLGAFVGEMVEVLGRTIPEKVRVSLDAVEDGSAFTVRADAARLRQALTNLALNARDAMSEGGELRFALSRLELEAGEAPPVAGMEAGPWVCLAVSDTGTGMTEEVQEHLFEPFFTTKEVGQGTGLGLAQVHGIVRQHEGAIDVESAPGRGTTFRIYLPAYEQEQAEAPASAAPQGEGKTILLVEGNEALRRAAQSVLESLGYRVVTAANGREALALSAAPRWSARGPAIDLVITELAMPEMDGPALIRGLTCSHPDLKALGMVGYGVEGVTEELGEAGFVEVIHKPLDMEELARAIRRALD